MGSFLLASDPKLQVMACWGVHLATILLLRHREEDASIFICCFGEHFRRSSFKLHRAAPSTGKSFQKRWRRWLHASCHVKHTWTNLSFELVWLNMLKGPVIPLPSCAVRMLFRARRMKRGRTQLLWKATFTGTHSHAERARLANVSAECACRQAGWIILGSSL